ncbi:MAG: LD-carboxypeptidase [Calditrichaeota bacterium]|nr:LD-carboxypeptidase [Calditrichota bacterium]
MKRKGVTRREFMGEVAALSAVGVASSHALGGEKHQRKPVIRPPRLRPGDTVGLVCPASAPFEPSAIREGKMAMEKLGFKVKIGRNVGKKYGYLGGTDQERATDVQEMFDDPQVKAIIALRGGYGCLRILNHLDYDHIRTHPKILLGYSDITILLLAVHQMTGLVTFHGPVALSTFSPYTVDLLQRVLMKDEPLGEIGEAPGALPLGVNGLSGRASGRLIGGNLTLVAASLGTPYEVDTDGRLLFLEEVGEEPYDIDRHLTHLLLAGKLDRAAGIALDRMQRCGPRDYQPAFPTTLSVEEVISDRLGHLGRPVVFGLSLGHAADKPTLPIGVMATLDAGKGRLSLDEPAVS